MCDHCGKVTNQKGYGGQITCRCENGDKKDDERREKERERGSDGRCSKTGKEVEGGSGGCFASKCCAVTMREESGGCCTGGGGASTSTRRVAKKSCCEHK